MEEIEKTTENTTEVKDHSKRNFALQLILFLSFALICPCAYLIWKFDLFTQTTSMQFGVWGIVMLGIMCSVCGVLIKFYLDGMKMKYSLMKQIMQGFISLAMPLLLALLILTWLKDNIDLVIHSLWVILPCEIVAIIVNPLPKWCFENNVQGIGEIADRVLAKRNIAKESK